MANKKTGTKEWAQVNVNIQLGCENNCRYCYARYAAVQRYHRCSAGQWADPVINNKKVDANYGRFGGIVMFPSTHDITMRNLSECLCVLRKLLDAGNSVLVVSKPRWQAITLICEQLEQYRSLLMFRFTIGTMSDELIRFWEPYAPLFKERLSCLKYAYTKGYRTSVSCEPYLDANVFQTFLAVKPYITEDFWVGKLRDFKNRVDLSALSPEKIEKYVTPLKAAQSDEMVRRIYGELARERLVKPKDSVREVIDSK